MPVFYDCQRCTACCRWPGEVRVSGEEIRRMAAHLGLDEDTFIQHYTRVRWDRQGLSLAERANDECVFLEGDNCRVQPVKPQQCRDFPNLWRFPGCEMDCQAVPREVGEAEYRRLVLAATGRKKLPPGRENSAGSTAPGTDVLLKENE